MSLGTLKSELSSGKNRNIYLFYGPEEHLKRVYLGRLKRLLLKEDFSEMNYIVFKGKVEEASLEEAVRTFPFFDDKKIILLSDTGVLKKAGWFTDYLDKLINNIPPYLSMIIYETGTEQVDKRLKTYKLLDKNGLPVFFDYQKPSELATWVCDYLSSFKIDISKQDALMLVTQCDRKMSDIISEMEKLAAWGAGSGSVNSEDIKLVCTSSFENTVFEMTDAISEGDTAQAILILDRMIAQKEPVQRVFFMIARHFRQLYQIKRLSGSGCTLNDSAKLLNINNFYIARKINTQSMKYKISKLSEALTRCREYDLAIKNGLLKDRMAVELLISEFTIKNKQTDKTQN